MTELMDAALGYVARGWSVIPIHHVREDLSCSCPDPNCTDQAGKHPRVTWDAYKTTAATESQVRKWWQTWPRANIGIVTGKVSGIIAIDVDPRHGGDDSLKDLGTLPNTLISLTGGGGEHLIYRHPGRIVQNGAGRNSGLPPGIDVRGDGGYIIAPPSMHRLGGRYSWDVGGLDEPAPIPPVIDNLLVNRKIGDVAPSSRHFDLQEIFERGIAAGERNDTLTRVAGHYAAPGNPYDLVLMSVRGVNATYCRPSLEDSEVVKIVDSIFAREEEKRRVADAITERLSTNGDAKDVVIPDERRAMARALWAEMGVPGVTDWIVIRSDQIEYVIFTATDESGIGDDLLNQGLVRKRIFNALGEVLNTYENKQEWPKRAKMLRDLAREEVGDSPRASERIDAWVEAFTESSGIKVEAEVGERGDLLNHSAIVVDGDLCLKPEVLFRFMENSLGEKLRINELRKWLRRAGWNNGSVWTGQSTTRAWRRTYMRDD